MKLGKPQAAIVILILSSTAALAQSSTLRGKVRSTERVTVNNAIVELRYSGGGMIAQTVTRNDGDFIFTGLTPAEYEVAVTIAGYYPTVEIARFSMPDRMSFSEVLNIEVLIRPRQENVLAAPGTHFAQDVPKTARAAYERGMTRLREGKSDEAVAGFREAIAVFDDYFDAQFALGKELFRTGNDVEALKALERARQINDRQDAVYYLFGLVMIKQGKFAVAEYAFREGTRLNSNSPALHFYHAQTLIELGIRGSDARQSTADLESANQELDRAWELSEKRLTAVHLQRARIHRKLGEKESAARDLENYLKAEPDAKNAAAIRVEITKLREPGK
ncbi:MAG TPA: tetratricopeptide repeat protein [Blastocatellia bacterium]|nr:tetratricopeptide repeat protein [Blastocatellia bacterium]